MKNITSIKILMILTLEIIIFSCSGKNAINTNSKYLFNDSLSIHSPNHSESFVFDNFIDSCYLVQLELIPEMPIGKIDKIISSDTLLFILDNSISKSLFIYTKKGNAVNVIHRSGKGVGEFIRMTDFDVDTLKKEILIKDNYRKKMVHFNYKGEFLKETKQRQYCMEFFVSGLDGMYLYNPQSSIIQERYNLFYIKKNKVKKKFFSFPEKMDNDGYCIWQYFPKSEGQRFYVQQYRNCIFSFLGDSLIPHLKIDFGMYNWPLNTYMREHKSMNYNDNYVTVCSFLESSKYYYFPYAFKNRIYHSYTCKTTGKTLNFMRNKEADISKDNVCELLVSNRNFTVIDDWFVSCLEPYLISSSADQSPLIEKLLKYSHISRLKPTDNPLLVFKKLKQYE